MIPKWIMFLFFVTIVFSELDYVTAGKPSQKKNTNGRSASKKMGSSESESEDVEDPDAGELEDRWKCVTDLNTCVETELAYNPTADETKTKELCTKQIKLFMTCREWKETWRTTKPTTTRRPRTKGTKTTTTTTAKTTD